MTIQQPTMRQVALPSLALRPRRGWALWQFARRKPLGAAGGLIVLALVFSALFASYVAPHNPLAVNAKAALEPPGGAFLLGTDNLGRDVLSRVIFGARISLLVGLLSVALGIGLGSMLGLASGYLGGLTDLVVQRGVDILISFPTLVLALAIVAVLGPSIVNVTLAIGIVMVPTASRVVRGSTLSVRENAYVEAASVVGCGHLRILGRHILPNVTAPIIVVATVNLGTAILSEAALSFLGVGPPPPTPTWGGMLSGEGRQFMEAAPWMALYPGLAISAVVFGFNLLGDALRDVWDPRLRGSG